MQPQADLRPSQLLWYFHDEEKSIEESINVIAATIYHQSLHPMVAAYARMITSGCGDNWMCKIKAIHDWLKKRFVYKEDPKEVDSFKSPVYILHEIQSKGYFEGDCDDATMISGALLKAAGFVIRLIAVSRRKEPNAPLEHIAILIEVPGMRKMYFDLTVNHPVDFEGRRVVHSDVI
jgi:hypothetical protein